MQEVHGDWHAVLYVDYAGVEDNVLVYSRADQETVHMEAKSG